MCGLLRIAMSIVFIEELSEELRFDILVRDVPVDCIELVVAWWTLTVIWWTVCAWGLGCEVLTRLVISHLFLYSLLE
jgi:hypothetical protein